MIHVLRPSHAASVADEIHTIVQAHGGRAVLLAVIRAILRQRRQSPARLSGVPPSLRADVGLPPDVGELPPRVVPSTLPHGLAPPLHVTGLYR